LRFKDNIIKLNKNNGEIEVKYNPITAYNMFNNFFINSVQNNLNKITISEINHVHKNVSFNEVFLKKIE